MLQRLWIRPRYRCSCRPTDARRDQRPIRGISADTGARRLRDKLEQLSCRGLGRRPVDEPDCSPTGRMSRPSVTAAASSTLSAPTSPATTHRSLGRTLSTAEFWALMERWRVPDAMAWELIEFPGKIGASGKRPRFRFVTRQKWISSFSAELNSTLAAAGHDPAWLHRKNRAPPQRSDPALPHAQWKERSWRRAKVPARGCAVCAGTGWRHNSGPCSPAET